MTISKVALLFDDQVRPDTTGVYCRRALAQLVEVTHFRPGQEVPRHGFDLYLRIDDGLDYPWPAGMAPRAYWAIDTHLDYEARLERARGCDLVFAAQRDGALRLRQDGIAGASWLPLACDPDVHGACPTAKTLDVCFVGHLFPGPRCELVNLIRSHYPAMFVGQRFFEDMAHLYASTRVVFNRSIRNDINMRVFEALASGSLLLTNDLTANGQTELFQDGVHLAVYRDGAELLERLRYYLAHEQEREQLAAVGRAEVLAKHTYRQRMATILQQAEQRPGPSVVVMTPPIDWMKHIPVEAHDVLVLDDSTSAPPWSQTESRHITVLAPHQLEDLNLSRVPATFDAVLVAQALGAADTDRRLLARIHSRLRPQGVLVAMLRPTPLTGAATSPANPNRALERLLYRSDFLIEGQPPPIAEETEGPSAIVVTARPVAKAEPGLTSVVILTHNQLDYTRQCLDSIRRYTDEPYELIVVDNGSTDGTVDYLASQPDVKLIANASNRGFPAGANQGMHAASGQQILLLNNDCVVTTGWLRRLLESLARDPRIALVGPCSNHVSGAQQIPVNYDTLAGLEDFAWDWAQAHDGQLEETCRLVGFCFLLRRELLDQIGFLDERFGIGCFEDDDYCLRAIQKGRRAVIARAAFVHHYGSRTFLGSGVDFTGVLRDNHERFRVKWASAATVPPVPDRYEITRAPGGGLVLAPPALSLCMIVRDSAATLPACLTSIRPFVDEMIVVDTGSTDDTVALARRLGARVYHFPWCQDFAAARNESLRHARGRWIFWMDADDTIDAANGRQLQALARQEPDPAILGYVMQVHCPGPEGKDDVTVVDHVKLLRNRPDLRFEGRIHEQVLPAVRRAGGETAWTDLYVVHSGYDHSPAGQEQKKLRDLDLLQREIDDRPEHPFTLFNLGMTYAHIGRPGLAVDYLARSIHASGPTESHLRKAYALLVYCYNQVHEADAAWQTCARGLSLFPEDVELRFRRGLLLHEAGRLEEAAATYCDVLQRGGTRYFTSVDRGLHGFKTRQNLALVYTDMGALDRAETEWRAIVAEVPGYRSGWRGLGDLLIRQGKTEEALALVSSMAEHCPVEASILKARLAQAAGATETARRELDQAVRDHPGDPEPWQALSQLYFEIGCWAEAARALEELTRLRPDDASAHHNLGTVYLRQEQPAAAVAALQRSLALRPRAPATYVQLGHALQHSGRLEEARTAWRTALDLDPNHGEARAALNAGSPAENRLEVISFRLQCWEHSQEISCRARGAVDRAILREVWERDAYGVRDLPHPPNTVVDIGAHIGAFTLLAAATWPRARILACECDPDNAQLLRANLAGHANVEVVEAAIGADAVQDIPFDQVVDKIHGNSGGGSCVRTEPGTRLIRVPALNVIDLWQSRGLAGCDLLKLDCEGSELPILIALASSGLLAEVGLIVGEWHAQDRDSVETVKERLRQVLEATHVVAFRHHAGGREGFFTARPAAASSDSVPPALPEPTVIVSPTS